MRRCDSVQIGSTSKRCLEGLYCYASCS